MVEELGRPIYSVSVMVYGMLAIVFVWNGYYQYHNLEAGAVGMDYLGV